MKKFIITEARPATMYWVYEVEANSEEEAIQKIENGDVESLDFETECDYSEDRVNYEIQEENQ